MSVTLRILSLGTVAAAVAAMLSTLILGANDGVIRALCCVDISCLHDLCADGVGDMLGKVYA